MESFRIVTLIRRLHHAIRTEIAEDVRAHGFEGITPSHIYVFQTPGPEGARPTELAQRTLMTKQAMNHLLAGLEAGGYLGRTTVPGDGRARILQLTPKGRALTEVIQQSASDIERRWSDALGARRMQDLISTLGQLDDIGTGDASQSTARSRLLEG
jgi:DNA-binding MarR family transcriptional regulator